LIPEYIGIKFLWRGISPQRYLPLSFMSWKLAANVAIVLSLPVLILHCQIFILFCVLWGGILSDNSGYIWIIMWPFTCASFTRFEVVAVVKFHIMVFWAMTLVGGYECSGGICCIHFQDWSDPSWGSD
jgi:hypothetical protein